MSKKIFFLLFFVVFSITLYLCFYDNDDKIVFNSPVTNVNFPKKEKKIVNNQKIDFVEIIIFIHIILLIIIIAIIKKPKPKKFEEYFREMNFPDMANKEISKKEEKIEEIKKTIKDFVNSRAQLFFQNDNDFLIVEERDSFNFGYFTYNKQQIIKDYRYEKGLNEKDIFEILLEKSCRKNDEYKKLIKIKDENLYLFNLFLVTRFFLIEDLINPFFLSSNSQLKKTLAKKKKELPYNMSYHIKSLVEVFSKRKFEKDEKNLSDLLNNLIDHQYNLHPETFKELIKERKNFDDFDNNPRYFDDFDNNHRYYDKFLGIGKYEIRYFSLASISDYIFIIVKGFLNRAKNEYSYLFYLVLAKELINAFNFLKEKLDSDQLKKRD